MSAIPAKVGENCIDEFMDKDAERLRAKADDDICNNVRKIYEPELPLEAIVEPWDACDESRFGWLECFVFIKFPANRAQAFRNASVKEKAVLSRYSIYRPASNVGFAYKVQVIEGNWDPKMSIGVFKFSTYNDAKMWLESDSEFRQQDFLTHVDIWIMPLINRDKTREGFQIMELISQDTCFFKDIFVHKYLPNEEASVVIRHGHAFVVNHERPYCWRGTPPPGHTIVNQFPDIASFERYLAGDEYKLLRDYRKFTANGFMIMAELEIDT